MNRRRTTRLAAACCTLVLALAACSSGGGDKKASAFDPAKGVPGADAGSFDASPADVKKGLAEDAWWYPSMFVDCKAADTDAKGCTGEPTEGVYNAIPKDLVANDWNLCAVLPTLSDPYWVAVDYGVTKEAKRLGIGLDVYDAGGYTELSTQLNQIDDCVAGGADAIIIGAISFDGLDAKVDQLVADGIVVIDALNGISSEKVSAHAVLNWKEMGSMVAEYLKSKNTEEHVAWFPGPPGAGWAEDANSGFVDALKGSSVSVGDTKYGDTAKDVQLSLVEDTLQADDKVTAIAGTAVTAEAAVAGGIKNDDVEIVADYLIPTTFDAIEKGDISCGVSDHPVVQARMTIDMAVRLLEKIPLDDKMGRAFPAPTLVCGPGAGKAANIDDFVADSTFAPDAFKPLFRVDN
jgi:protein TorT